MADVTKKYPSLADVYRDLTLFFKIDGNIPFSLADFTVIAEGRWDYLRNNWDFIKTNYSNKIELLPNGPEKVAAQAQHKDFTLLVEDNRFSVQNPLSNKDTIRKYKDLLDMILITDIGVNVNEQTVIDRDVQRVLTLQKDDFYEMRERVRITHDKTADSMGLSDDSYNTLYERVSVSQIMLFNIDNFKILSALMALFNQITGLIPTKMVYNESPDPFSVVRNALNNSSIPINSYQTGLMVPFPAGATLESLSAKYLGTPDKGLEIATANNLKFPYIDEVGRKVFLTINGIGNLIIVELGEKDNFFINQGVNIGSSGVKATKRVIVNIEEDKINDQLLITVNGTANMSSYTTTQRAFIFSYMPYTINSDKFIIIPAESPVGFSVNTQEPWFVKALPSDVRNMGVDVAIGSGGDLVFDNNGDLALVYGLANGAQALNLKVQTSVGELIRDPAFGFLEIAGKYNNNEITQTLLTTIMETAISGDDRFSGVNGLGYTITDTHVLINTTIKLAGSNGSVPLTFQLPKG